MCEMNIPHLFHFLQIKFLISDFESIHTQGVDITRNKHFQF